MLQYLKINRWDLNFILTMIGFPFFTILISDSVASIGYRAFALLVALTCLFKTGISIPRVTSVRIFLIVLLYVSCQSLYGVFFGEYEHYPYSGVKFMFLLFNVGILWIPLLAFISGFSRIRWSNAILWTFILLFVTVLHADFRTFEIEAAESGRYDMGRLSTLAFGDNGSYLVLLATSILATRKAWLTKFKTITVLTLVIAILAGVFGIMKAGSRGPLVGCLFGLVFLIYSMKGYDRRIFVALVVLLVASGAISLTKLENFAPVLFNRFEATIEDGDMSGRDELFAEAIARFEEHPIFGSNPVSLSKTQFSTCHNVYLETLVGGGFFIFSLFAFALLCIAIKSFREKKKLQYNTAYLFLFSLFFCNMGRGFSGIMLTSNSIYAFAVVGCGIALYYNKNGYYQ